MAIAIGLQATRASAQAFVPFRCIIPDLSADGIMPQAMCQNVLSTASLRVQTFVSNMALAIGHCAHMCISTHLCISTHKSIDTVH